MPVLNFSFKFGPYVVVLTHLLSLTVVAETVEKMFYKILFLSREQLQQSRNTFKV